MPVSADFQAHGVYSELDNVALTPDSSNVKSKIVVVATYDPLKTSVVDEVPKEVFSSEDAGAQTGFGFPMQRLVDAVIKGTNGAVRVFMQPQSDATFTAADGQIAWTGTTSAAGTIPLRIGGELYDVPIPSGSTIEATSDAVVTFVNAVADTPVIAAKTAVTFETTFTSKAKGLEQNNIMISLITGDNESLPTGLAGVITLMANGLGTPDIDDALNGLGTGDEANQLEFTDLVHGYGIDTGTIDKISAYVGEGNTATGLYKNTIDIAFSSFQADITPSTGGLTALQVITAARTQDRANGYLGAPDEEKTPTEFAAQATGHIAVIAQNTPPANYSGTILSGIDVLSVSDKRWTKESTVRNTAVETGISPVIVKENSSLVLQNVITSYAPSDIPTASNGYKSKVQMTVTNNMRRSLRSRFEDPSWLGFFIVADSSKVTDTAASLKARDLLDAVTEVNNFADFAEKKGWIHSAAFMKANSTVAVRGASNGFDIVLVYKLPGEGQVLSVVQRFDANIAA